MLFGGRSQTMRYAYPFTLCRRVVVATADLGADNLHLLSSDHWLSKAENVFVLRLTAPTLAQPAGAFPDELPRAEQMRRWTVAEVVSFLKSKDLAGPTNVLFANGVRGEDFIPMLVESFVHDLRLSEFTARRLAAYRLLAHGRGASQRRCHGRGVGQRPARLRWAYCLPLFRCARCAHNPSIRDNTNGAM